MKLRTRHQPSLPQPFGGPFDRSRSSTTSGAVFAVPSVGAVGCIRVSGRADKLLVGGRNQAPTESLQARA
eukprot:4450103-Pyramimonas_sp.AAC.1